MTDSFWRQSYPDNVPAEIDPNAHSSVTALLAKTIDANRDKVAFSSFGANVTYGRIDQLADQFGAYLQNVAKVTKGDRIAVMAPNILAFPISFLAIARLGAVQVNVNPLYTASELKHQLNDAGVETIVIFAGSTPILAEIIDETSVKTVIVAAPGDGSEQALPSPPVDARLENHENMASALEKGAALNCTHADVNNDDVLFLQYTGGTTGLSKGATLTHGNLVANTEQFMAMMGDVFSNDDETIITALPLYHIFALMVNFISYFSVGARNILVADPRNMDAFIETIKDAGFTAFTGVNTLYAGLMAHPKIGEVDFSRCKLAMGGGAPIYRTTSDQWEQLSGRHILEGYGLSETSPVLTMNPPWLREFTETVGLPIPSTDIVLLDGDDKPVAIGDEGEICARGPQVMRGYWNRDDANKEAFTEDGYFRTGDIGVFDNEGKLKIVDRKKAMILVSGFNVYPNEIEAVAARHPDIVETACIGAPDKKTGEAVKLFAVLKSGSRLTEDALRDFCRETLAGYKVPKQIEFMDELPKSNVGKILRRALKPGA
ncbi:MAG: AMP-binding protein [Pseudomonadota bacterium]